ncbi:MAG: chemotaxis-specific protein-glutamate methyltransferase CheB [Myxococcaceae bacterium]
MAPKKQISVLVVDDSAICRDLIQSALARDPDIRVVGMCGNGQEAVALTRELKPDVITMDIEMPVMSGLDAIERIMATQPTPVLVLTSDPQGQRSDLTYRALELGALALQVKPSVDADYESWALAREVRLLSSVTVIRHVRARHGGSAGAGLHGPLPTAPVELVAIGCSTGGPLVLQRILGDLPKDFPVPIVVVQHINPSFAESLAGWLDQTSPLTVKLAQEGDELRRGKVLIASPGRHLVMPRRGKVMLRHGEPRDGHLPSATMLFESAARTYGPSAVGIILTGMGADGAEGLLAMRRAGARTLAQSKDSCVVFGMPGAAVQMNAVDEIVHADAMADAIQRLVTRNI